MSRILITGSADGLGMMAARALIQNGHKVVLHARNEKRANDAMRLNPGAEQVIIADLSSKAQTIRLANDANATGRFDAIIHNAAIGYRAPLLTLTEDGLPEVFLINSLAHYILTALLLQPSRLIYISSGLNLQGDTKLQDLLWEKRRWNGYQAYSDSKLHNVILAQAIARRWPGVHVNSVEPGWVATKMGGAGAPDNLEEGYKTQCWLAISDDEIALQSGGHYYHFKPKHFSAAAKDVAVQDSLLRTYQEISGIKLPY